MSGRRLRALAVIDEWSRESLAIEVDVSLTGERVTRVLDRLGVERGLPTLIQSDNGPEFTGRVLDQWAYDNQVRLRFIEPGKPIQNAFIESFQQPAARGVSQRACFRLARRRAAQDRAVANPIQPRATALQPGLSNTGGVRGRGRPNKERERRAHRLASRLSAGRRGATRVALESKTRQFFVRPQKVKGGRKNCDKETRNRRNRKMNQNPANTNLRVGYQKG